MSAAVALNSPAFENSPKKSSVQLGKTEFDRIKGFLAADAGIELSDDKVNLVHSRLQKQLRALRLGSFAEYCDLIDSPEGQAERTFMLCALTTNVTRFFREPHHFQHLAKVSLPPLVAKARSGGRVRIWSGGCSSGQEPYCIATVLLSLMPDAGKYDIKILATDIDRNMVLTGRRGMYDANLTKNIPEKIKRTFFETLDGNSGQIFVANEKMKSLVSFRELNLNASRWPMRGKFDIIFCRNTVIYFNEETRQKVWTRFKEHLTPNGFLYIGHSERVSGPATKSLLKTDTTTYQLQ